MGVKAALPRYELYLYTAVLGVAMVWAASWIVEASSENVNRKTFKESVKPGWHYFGRKMASISLSLFHVMSLIFGLYGLLAVLVTMGWTFLGLILSHCFMLYSEALVTGSFDLQDVLFYGGCGFSIMRCMSFALENCDRKEGSFSFYDLLKYNFYLPFFFFGPIMTFDQFHVQRSGARTDLPARETPGAARACSGGVNGANLGFLATVHVPVGNERANGAGGTLL
ncbi:hypothetical protein CRUP_037030 [Coryphaenoides rupestris]|nr:hypothetical protein CRUP_037030 [Coryphaenoides rupestris]